MAVWLSGLRACHALPAERFLLLISVRCWFNPRAIVRLKGLGKLNKFKDHAGNRTRYIPACSLMPLPTSLQRPLPTETSMILYNITSIRHRSSGLFLLQSLHIIRECNSRKCNFPSLAGLHLSRVWLLFYGLHWPDLYFMATKRRFIPCLLKESDCSKRLRCHPAELAMFQLLSIWNGDRAFLAKLPTCTP
jgi:hypothetical protein